MQFEIVEEYINKINITGDLLEIGIGNHSTPLFGNIAHRHQKILHSVDVNTEKVKRCSQTYKSNNIKFYNLKGEDFLDWHTDLKFSVVLLDNFDWDITIGDTKSEFIQSINNQKLRYKESFHMEMTNINSQIAHLQQALKITNMLTYQSIIICDDTELANDQTYIGKCGAAIPYLMTLGFKPYNENRGVILIRL